MKKVKFIIEEVISQEFEIEVADGFDYDDMSLIDNLAAKVKELYRDGVYVLDNPDLQGSSASIVCPQSDGERAVWYEF